MASKVSVGKTAPVPLGQQPSANSLPVVFAEDQQPIPVEEQNKIQSEVALSLLGIPRAEVALGIFADVNTYDINPTEWAQFPVENVPTDDGTAVKYGVEHIPDEAGAKLVATDGNTTILTSKRFFRYQPGRVSASTMGVRMNTTRDPLTDNSLSTADKNRMKGAPSLKKWGIFDKFDGYYFEVANAGEKNDFRCVRRSQGIIPTEQAGYTGNFSWVNNKTNTDFQPDSNFGKAGEDPVIIRDGLIYVAAAIYDPSLCYSPDDVRLIDNIQPGNPVMDSQASKPDFSDSYRGSGERLKKYSFDSKYALRLASFDGTSTWDEVMDSRKHMFPFDQSTDPLVDESTSIEDGYIRADAHCNFFNIVSNLNRKNNYGGLLGGSTDYSAGGANQVNFLNSGVTTAPSQYDDLYTWDPNPNTDNKNKKIWHLLVNIQGQADGSSDTRTITTADLTAKGDVPNREVFNGNVTLKEWFNICVPRPYRMVYEWRPVRAMFSGDKLDGDETVVRWSDINTSAADTIKGSTDGINRPGDPVQTADNEDLKTQSAYKIDFEKVTMWKTEFSWYGAVGAVFLCYVPVSNGEARWVRVHHIRASNQHSVASLGNATLPITYLTHGGIQSGTGASGNELVKYGASYYIDGGDKGTVKLLSKASDYSKAVAPGFVVFPGGGNTSSGQWAKDTNEYSMTFASASTYTGTSTRKTLFDYNTAVGLMGAYVEGDTTNKVKFVTDAGSGLIRLQFTGKLTSEGNDLKIIVPRAQVSLLSFRAKDFILNRKGDEVRNRLQIYPLKLGAGITGGGSGSGGSDLLTLRTIKNPLKIVTNANFSAQDNTIFGYSGTPGRVITDASKPYVNTKTSTLPVEVSWDTNGAPDNVISTNGYYRYGYFMASKDVDTAQNFNPSLETDYSGDTKFPVLGRLYKDGGKWYFAKLFSYPENIYITGYFLPQRSLSMGAYTDATTSYGMFAQETVTNDNHKSSSDQIKWDKLEADGIVTWEEITRLSGVRVGQDMKLTPIADTGNEILAYYGGAGGYQFDLQDYFAYNKEYLSFPLTDEVDILNIYGHYDINQVAAADVKKFSVNTALTWEEQ